MTDILIEESNSTLTSSEKEHLLACQNVIGHIKELLKIGGFFDANKIGYIKVFFEHSLEGKDQKLVEEHARIHSFSIWDNNGNFISNKEIKNEVISNLRIFESLYQNHLKQNKNNQALIFVIDFATNEKFIYSLLCSDELRAKMFAIELQNELPSKDLASRVNKI